MGLPVFKDCCCLELRWGALIVGILDLLLAIFGGNGSFLTGAGLILWYITIAVHVAHGVACIFVLFSICKQNKNLVILYLITGLLRIIMDIVFLICVCVMAKVGDHILLLVIIVLQIPIYFWFVIYSWYRMLGGSTPAD